MDATRLKFNRRTRFARLLASENLTVITDEKAKTAYFQPQSRVLTLPEWDKVSDQVYDTLVIHEVGHALFSPQNWHERLLEIDPCELNHQIVGSIVNIVEDARIEKFMKRKFPGSVRDFIDAYKEIHQNGFFSVEKKQLTQEVVDKMSIADRINLFFKTRNTIWDVKFTPEEQEIVNEMELLYTFDDVIEVSKKLYEAQTKEMPKIPVNLLSEYSGPLTPEMMKTLQKISNGIPSDVEPVGMGDGDQDDNIPKTAEQKKQMFDPSNNPNHYTIAEFEKSARNFIAKPQALNEFRQIKTVPSEFFTTFNNVVSTMAMQFERRKAAIIHQRKEELQSGLINPKALHKYKTDENIFLTWTKRPVGKNHGFVMFVDWSGSMESYLNDTIKQMCLLAMFARKIRVPFEIYAFLSNSHSDGRYDRGNGVSFSGKFLTLLSSTMNGIEFKDQITKLSSIKGSSSLTANTNLTGTALDFSVAHGVALVKEFIQKHRTEITNVIYFTDGDNTDGYSVSNSGNVQWIVNPATRLNYPFGKYSKGAERTRVLMEYMKDALPINLINFHVNNTCSSSMFDDIITATEKQSFKTNGFAKIVNDPVFTTGYILSPELLDLSSSKTKNNKLLLLDFVNRITSIQDNIGKK